MFDLVFQMLQFDAKSRPTATECMQHKWFKLVNQSEIKPLPKFQPAQITTIIEPTNHNKVVGCICEHLYFSYSKVAKPGTDLYLILVTNALYIYYAWFERQKYPNRAHKNIKQMHSLHSLPFSQATKTSYIKSATDISVKLLYDKAYKYCCGKYHFKTKCYIYEFNIITLLWGSLLRCLPVEVYSLNGKSIMLKIIADPRCLMSKELFDNTVISIDKMLTGTGNPDDKSVIIKGSC